MNDSLYREQLLEIYKNPGNRGTLSDPSVDVTVRNRFCGDTLNLQLQITDGIITEASFNGESCMVTIASSDLVTEELKGKSLEDAAKISKGDVLEMLGVELTTSRVKCATLILEALEASLKELNE
ncbi:iron-sulfur cluster assembly scaffold protein [candidate division WWE3 bacterium]|jgi:nitrogen fixation protein NifU and related proteins|nr:iron-sulfur cluster assembly scaffold protein [candidate division WWE3 bacterium]MBT7350235.1 iron-sulfur cluster assembly scaffold protein [candidate division WWE3 bacterium]